jgi:glutamate formiminotransferase
VINVSEGRDEAVIDELRIAAGPSLLDLHHEQRHNRAVLTLAGPDVEQAARSVTTVAVERLDLDRHAGAHPRIGVVDVVPFVPLEGATMDDAVAARNRFAAWAADALGVPCYFYGPERSLPDVRREAFGALAPDVGPSEPHPTAGAICCGARPVLVAYNVWLVPGTDVTVATQIARAVRGPAVRALGLDLEGLAQVSMNLIDWRSVGPADAYDAVAARAAEAGTHVHATELVGLLPGAALDAIPQTRWADLGLSRGQTIEACVRRAGFGSIG